MEWITEALENLFTDLVARIDSFIEMFDGFYGFGIFAFLNYVWYLCIPQEITDLVLLLGMFLLVFAFIRHSK